MHVQVIHNIEERRKRINYEKATLQQLRDTDLNLHCLNSNPESPYFIYDLKKEKKNQKRKEMFNYSKRTEGVRLQKHWQNETKQSNTTFLRFSSLHGILVLFLVGHKPGFHIFRSHNKFSDITWVKSGSKLFCQKVQVSQKNYSSFISQRFRNVIL